jgi:hypothetical protein
MNYQKMCDAPMNYQLDQNRAFNYQRQPFFPIRQSNELKQTVNGSHDRHTPFYPHFLSLSPHELPPSSSFSPMNYNYLPTCPHVKRHMTR